MNAEESEFRTGTKKNPTINTANAKFPQQGQENRLIVDLC